jgi:hypothetical protein
MGAAIIPITVMDSSFTMNFAITPIRTNGTTSMMGAITIIPITMTGIMTITMTIIMMVGMGETLAAHKGMGAEAATMAEAVVVAAIIIRSCLKSKLLRDLEG